MVSNRLLEDECAVLENGSLALHVIKAYGPRVISLGLRGGENIFAEIPHLKLDCPGKGGFYFHGDHRVWHAPEDPAITYLPDDTPVEITSSRDQLLVIQAVEPGGTAILPQNVSLAEKLSLDSRTATFTE